MAAPSGRAAAADVAPATFTVPLGPVIPVVASLITLGILAGATTQQLLAGLAALGAGALLYGLARAGVSGRAPA